MPNHTKNHYKIKSLDLGEKIRLSIRSRGWTYSGVAKALGVKCSTITYWCNGDFMPNEDHRNDLINLFTSVPSPSFKLNEKDFKKD